MYNWTLKTYRLHDGGRFSTLVTPDSVPAYYPTCYALSLRQQSLAHNTIVAYLNALLHFSLFAVLEEVDIHRRTEVNLSCITDSPTN